MLLPQFLLFCVVGVSTTLVDFTVFNLLTRSSVAWRRIPANTVSVATAMTWSFLANWWLVFHPAGHEWLRRAERFLVTTAFSAFVLQNAVLYLTTYVWKGPANLALALARKLSLSRRLGGDVVARNACKALGVSAGLVWNFYWYKFFVYAA
ncbi:MAG TPA: GtrA family protein [Candidatus Angelobacter sp.]|nr:GtrA family protein [Candidatus Angelobacter sp.]